MTRRIFAVAAVVAVGLSGCASKRESPPPAPVESSAAAPAAMDTSSSIRPGSSEDFRVNVGDTVHFDYDRYSVGAEAQATLQRQAAWLNKYPAVMLVIEGHCDERGTREYNLALGARRAQAIKELSRQPGGQHQPARYDFLRKRASRLRGIHGELLVPKPAWRLVHSFGRRIVTGRRYPPLRM